MQAFSAASRFSFASAWPGRSFVYAGIWQIQTNFDAGDFLEETKTFHSFFMLFAAPSLLPYANFLVHWGHLLIGLSLLAGLLVRISSVFGLLLLITYYFAHVDFPYVEGNVNFIMDYHLVYAGAMVYLIVMRAGHVWGLDGWLEREARHDPS